MESDMSLVKRIWIGFAFLVWLSGCVTPANTLPAQTDVASLATGEIYSVGDLSFTRQVIDIDFGTLVSGDFNGDGTPDLLDAGDPLLTILLGNGQGGLDRFSVVPGGESPTDFALSDLDDDGDLDVVVANHNTDYLTILLGDGDGNFEPASNSPFRINVLPHPHTVRLVDLDNDGYEDLLVDDRQGEGMQAYRGLGRAEFGLPTLIDVGGDPYLGLGLGDLNGDGLLDMVSPNPSEVGVLLNTSEDQISFEPAPTVPATTPFAIGLADFNGDGLLDLITGSGENSSVVQLYAGDGRGGFEEYAYSPMDFVTGAKNLIVGDFNADGFADAAVDSYQSADVLVILGGPDGVQTGTLSGEAHPWGLAAADFNADGLDDLVIADDTTGTAYLYLSFVP
jgi:FG-GAP-like repeat